MHIWRTNWDSCSRLIFLLTSEQSYLVLWAREVNSNPHKVLSSSRLFDKLVSVNFSFSQIMHNGKWPPFKKQKNKSFWCAVFNQMHFIRFKSSKYALSWLVLCSLGNKKKSEYINDLFEETMASKWLWASCPSDYMFNDAHQNFFSLLKHQV